MRVCSGPCGLVFQKMHLLLQHRRRCRCGGEWNEHVYVPTHMFAENGNMIYYSRPGVKFDPNKPPLVDESKIIHRNVNRIKSPKHKARIPGTVRRSRLPGGSGFRNNWQNDA